MTEELSELRAEARADSRSTVLRAKREVYEEFLREAYHAGDQLRSDASYAALVVSLEEQARARLGVNVEIELDEHVGGVVGRANGRRVDYRIPTLVDRCISRMGDRIGELWR